MKKFFIWLDDERPMLGIQSPYLYNQIMFHAHNYQECIDAIEEAQKQECEIWIHFDNDLGEEKEGYDVAKYIVENQIPIKYRIHTMNPVARKNIDGLLSHYGYEQFQW